MNASNSAIPANLFGFNIPYFMGLARVFHAFVVARRNWRALGTALFYCWSSPTFSYLAYNACNIRLTYNANKPKIDAITLCGKAKDSFVWNNISDSHAEAEKKNRNETIPAIKVGKVST